MIKKLGKLIAKNASGLMLFGAGVGVVTTAYFAVKDSRKDEVAVLKAEAKKDRTLSDDEIADMVKEQGYSEEEVEDARNGEAVPADFKYLSKKERAIIFAKSYWRTGLSMAGTFTLMILSHKQMAKQLAGATAAIALIGAKKDEVEEYFKKNYPKEYAEFKKNVTKENIKKIFEDEPRFVKEESYDGRQRYYDPWSCQMFFATEAQIKEAECTVNELIINTGSATLFDYLATFPESSGVKLQPWMKYFGWYEGGDTAYSYNAGYFGSYLKPIISKESVIFKGDKEEVFTISWQNNPDLDPDLSSDEVCKIDDLIKDLSDEDPLIKEIA